MQNMQKMQKMQMCHLSIPTIRVRDSRSLAEKNTFVDREKKEKVSSEPSMSIYSQRRVEAQPFCLPARYQADLPVLPARPWPIRGQKELLLRHVVLQSQGGILEDTTKR